MEYSGSFYAGVWGMIGFWMELIFIVLLLSIIIPVIFSLKNERNKLNQRAEIAKGKMQNSEQRNQVAEDEQTFEEPRSNKSRKAS